MKIRTVYIASPYTKGDVAMNVRNSILAAEQVRNAGLLPFCPLLSHLWHCMSPHPYEFWTEMDLEWLEVCDCILRLPGESAGADKEVVYMLKLRKPVFFSIYELLVSVTL
jgi:hypothetical protein